jgi:hypothetical protein
VGNLSLKGCVGKADFAPVSGWQPDSETVGNNELPSFVWFTVGEYADATFQRKVAHLMIAYF